ncbi:TPA: hypothetical protein ACSF45_004687, partial [Shigella sonnei]
QCVTIRTLQKEKAPRCWITGKTKATGIGRQWEQRKSNASPTMPDLRLVGNVISQIWFVPGFATRAFSCAL